MHATFKHVEIENLTNLLGSSLTSLLSVRIQLNFLHNISQFPVVTDEIDSTKLANDFLLCML